VIRAIRTAAFAAAVMLLANGADAQPVFGAHLLSRHIGTDAMNNANVGAYVVVDGWTAGVYRNSLRRTSVYAGHQFDWGPFSLTAGVVSGYKREVTWHYTAAECTEYGSTSCWKAEGTSRTELMPMLAPSVRIGPARVWWLPSLGIGRGSGVVHLSIEGSFQ